MELLRNSKDKKAKKLTKKRVSVLAVEERQCVHGQGLAGVPEPTYHPPVFSDTMSLLLHRKS